jgi:hypothetical protein
LFLLALHTWFFVEPAPTDFGQDTTFLHLPIEPAEQIVEILARAKLHFSHMASPPAIQFFYLDHKPSHFTPRPRLRQQLAGSSCIGRDELL